MATRRHRHLSQTPTRNTRRRTAQTSTPAQVRHALPRRRSLLRGDPRSRGRRRAAQHLPRRRGRRRTTATPPRVLPAAHLPQSRLHTTHATAAAARHVDRHVGGQRLADVPTHRNGLRSSLQSHPPPHEQNVPRHDHVPPPKTHRRRARRHHSQTTRQDHHAHRRAAVRARHRKLDHALLRRKTTRRRRATPAKSHLLHRHVAVPKNLLVHQTRTKTLQTQIHSRHAPRTALLRRKPRRCLLRTRVATRGRRLHLHRLPGRTSARSHPRTPRR